MWQITGTRVCQPSTSHRPDGWATWASPDLCVYCYLLGRGKLFITATARRTVPAGPASARATSILGGKMGGCPGEGRSGVRKLREEGQGPKASSSPRPRTGPNSGTVFWGQCLTSSCSWWCSGRAVSPWLSHPTILRCNMRSGFTSREKLQAATDRTVSQSLGLLLYEC